MLARRTGRRGAAPAGPRFALDPSGKFIGAGVRRGPVRFEEGVMAAYTLTSQENGHHLHLARGDTLRVVLRDISTTGYRWAIDALDEGVLGLVGTDLTPAGAVGGGGERTFHFVANAPGQTALRLKLWREWEGDRSVIERFEVSVNVT
jgi:inhibitor of cysteine peptidase